MTMGKPIIGINCDFAHTDAAWSRVRAEYIDAVVQAGGIPVLLACAAKPEVVEHQLRMVNGVLGVGGADHHPEIFGQTRHPMTRLLPERRQSFDLAFFTHVYEMRLPALMICGSMQGMNIAQGGTMEQHLDELTANHDNLRYELAHEIKIEAGSLISQILKTKRAKVNSDHHQSIHLPGSGLRVVGVAEDGTPEVFEAVDDTHPLIGVQWHPECIPAEASSKKLFNWLVSESVKHRPIQVSTEAVRLSPFV